MRQGSDKGQDAYQNKDDSMQRERNKHTWEKTRASKTVGKNDIDITLFSEKQKNTGGMEAAGPWGKHVCFFSTGINPKKRETQEQNREKKATKNIKKNRNKKQDHPATNCNARKTLENGSSSEQQRQRKREKTATRRRK